MIFPLLCMLSSLLLTVNVTCFSVEELCAKRCLYYRGGILCNCNVMHFAGKRSDVQDHNRALHSLHSGHQETVKTTELESNDSKHRLHDLAEVIGRLSQNQVDNNNEQENDKLFADGTRPEEVSPMSDPDVSPRIPQLLHEFEHLWKAREKLAKSISDRESFVAGNVDDNNHEHAVRKQDVYNIQNRNHGFEESSSREDHSSSSTKTNDESLRSQVAETVRELMESNLQHADPFNGNSNHRDVISQYYLQNKRHSLTSHNDSPSMPDKKEMVASGYTNNKQLKGGLTLIQLDRLLKHAIGKGYSRLPNLEDFDDKGTTS